MKRNMFISRDNEEYLGTVACYLGHSDGFAETLFCGIIHFGLRIKESFLGRG